MKELILNYTLLAGLTAFAMFGIDKYKAIRSKWRIPESALIMVCMVGGAFGGLAGMYLFHHKTRHLKFQILVPLSAVLWCVILILFYGNLI